MATLLSVELSRQSTVFIRVTVRRPTNMGHRTLLRDELRRLACIESLDTESLGEQKKARYQISANSSSGLRHVFKHVDRFMVHHLSPLKQPHLGNYGTSIFVKRCSGRGVLNTPQDISRSRGPYRPVKDHVRRLQAIVRIATWLAERYKATVGSCLKL